MHHDVHSATHFGVPSVLAGIETAILLLLLSITAVIYLWAIYRLVRQGVLPAGIAPPRITLAAIGTCAARAIPELPGFLQLPLTCVVIGLSLFAISCIIRNVIAARRLPLAQRTLINLWAAILIPPIIGVGLLPFELTLSTNNLSLLIDAFIFANTIPAIYIIVQVPHILRRRQAQTQS